VDAEADDASTGSTTGDDNDSDGNSVNDEADNASAGSITGDDGASDSTSTDAEADNASTGFAARDNSGSDGTSTGVNGCISANTELNINAGADGSFFDIFDASTTVPLFDKSSELFSKCFGASTPTKRTIAPQHKRKRHIHRPRAMYSRDLSVSCLATPSSDLTTIG